MNYPVEQGMTPRVGAQFFINPEDTAGGLPKTLCIDAVLRYSPGPPVHSLGSC